MVRLHARGRVVYTPDKKLICAPLKCLAGLKSFYGELEHENFAGLILLLEGSRGSTVAPYVMYRMWKQGRLPIVLMLVKDAEPMLIAGAVLTNLPLIDNVSRELLETCVKHGICNACVSIEGREAKIDVICGTA